MWNESKSEVVRIEEVLLHNGTAGEALYQKFRSARREDVRLAAALRGYFHEGEEHREEYFSYLSRRLRPAAEALIETNRVGELAQLEEKGLFTPELTDEFLHTAITLGRPELIVWLLRQKETRFGFRDRDFRL